MGLHQIFKIDKEHNYLGDKLIEFSICEMFSLHISTFFPISKGKTQNTVFRGIRYVTWT